MSRPRFLVGAIAAVAVWAVGVVGLVQHGVAAPTGLAAKPSARSGYAWSAGGTAPTCDTAPYSFNSSGGLVCVHNDNGGAGQSQASFAGLPKFRPANAEVTTYSADGTCRINGWRGFKQSVVVNVACFSFSGIPQDGEYTVLITSPASRPRGVLDFAGVVLGRRGPAVPAAFSFNSSHRVNKVKSLGKGRYQVTFPGPAARGTTGVVHVSGWVSGTCEVTAWHGTPSGEVVDIGCHDSRGKFLDLPFDVTYVRGNNLMGLNGATDANAYAGRPAAPSPYQPADQYDSAPGARVTVARIATGEYKVTLAGSGGRYRANGGDVQVSSVGTHDDHCQTLGWVQGKTPVAYVQCFTNGGVTTNSPFTIEWVVAG